MYYTLCFYFYFYFEGPYVLRCAFTSHGMTCARPRGPHTARLFLGSRGFRGLIRDRARRVAARAVGRAVAAAGAPRRSAARRAQADQYTTFDE